jgi:hypothetical protein
MGEEWYAAQTARLMNLSKTHLYRLLELADTLSKEPRIEAVWNCSSFVEAYKVGCVDPKELEAREELESRRKAVLQSSLISEYTEESTTPVDGQKSPVPSGESTAERPVVHLGGINKAFRDAKPDEDFLSDQFWAVLSYGGLDPIERNHIKLALNKQHGFAVLWRPSLTDWWPSITMPWMLTWNKITIGETKWPFTNNIELGVVIGNESPAAWPNPSSSVVSAIQEDPDEIPFGVVNFTLKAICPTHRSPVLLPKNAPVVSVAMCGHPMVWFEEDKKKFELKCEKLKSYYEMEIPNVDVRP